MKIRLPFIAFLFIQLTVYSQSSSWHLQPTTIKTRWASRVNPANTLPEYPRPQLQRANWTNLNGLWQYAITDKNAASVSTYNGSILVPYPVESALSGVKKQLLPSQLLWYRRTLTRPALKPGDRVLLHFGAVDFDATVYVNGKEVGRHKGGYQNFSFDITDNLKGGTNELQLKVWDPTDQGPNPHGKQVLNAGSIWYTPSSGIWQTVWMETVPKNYIEKLVITPDVDRSVVRVTVKAATDAPVLLTTAGKTVSGKSNKEIEIPIKDAKLWSPDAPFLYDLSVQMGADKVKGYFGMRKIEVKKDEKGFDRIFLNNKYTYNLGTLDQGFWPDGLYTAPTDEALQFDIKAIKAMGFNTIRKHIKIEPERWYYYTDKLGMLVWQDMVNPGSLSEEGKTEFENECEANINQLFNHPSITTWVLFNEKWGQYDQQRLTQWLKRKDPTRLVNGHSGEILYVNDKLRSPSPDAFIDADIADVHAYPNPGHVQVQPGKASVVGEFGGIGVPIEGHIWDDLVAGWGYDGVVTPAKMKQQYAGMVDSLKVLEREGLSGSIYTQPFDVESEQNGLLTYDREIIKLPAATFRSINGKLWPSTSNLAGVTAGFSAKTAEEGGSADYAERLKAYEGGKRDSAFLRGLALMAAQQKDGANVSRVGTAYFNQLKNPFDETNLKMIRKTTQSTKDPGFNFFYKNAAKINAILGDDESEALTTMLIERDFINPYTSKGTQDWGAIRSNLVTQYGALGEEIALQSQFLYAVNHGDWSTFSKATNSWFSKYGKNRKWISTMLINQVAWAVFENTGDTEALQAALTMTAYAVSVDPGMPELLDTHANLLYRLGKKDEALQWEEKAAAFGNQEILQTLEKMKKGEPTWPTK